MSIARQPTSCDNCDRTIQPGEPYSGGYDKEYPGYGFVALPIICEACIEKEMKRWHGTRSSSTAPATPRS